MEINQGCILFDTISTVVTSCIVKELPINKRFSSLGTKVRRRKTRKKVVKKNMVNSIKYRKENDVSVSPSTPFVLVYVL